MGCEDDVHATSHIDIAPEVVVLERPAQGLIGFDEQPFQHLALGQAVIAGQPFERNMGDQAQRIALLATACAVFLLTLCVALGYMMINCSGSTAILTRTSVPNPAAASQSPLRFRLGVRE